MDNLIKLGGGNSRIFIACGSGYTAHTTTTMTVRAYNNKIVSVSNNKLTFLKDCKVVAYGGHGSTGSSGINGGAASTYYQGTYSGRISNGFAGYSCGNWAGSFTKEYKKGDTLYFETYGIWASSGETSASVVGWFSAFIAD